MAFSAHSVRLRLYPDEYCRRIVATQHRADKSASPRCPYLHRIAYCWYCWSTPRRQVAVRVEYTAVWWCAASFYVLHVACGDGSFRRRLSRASMLPQSHNFMNGMGAQYTVVHLCKIEQSHRVQVLELEPRRADYTLVRLPRQPMHCRTHASAWVCARATATPCGSATRIVSTRVRWYCRVRLSTGVAARGLFSAMPVRSASFQTACAPGREIRAPCCAAASGTMALFTHVELDASD